VLGCEASRDLAFGTPLALDCVEGMEE